MAEVLSQSQIDALLNSVKGGSLAKGEDKASGDNKFKKYDFSSPKMFTKDRLKILSSIHENMAHSIASQLNSILRTSCEIELFSVEEQRYSEFSYVFDENDMLILINASIQEGATISTPIIMHTSCQLVYSMIERMLGGSGEDLEKDILPVYTEVEVMLFESIIRHIIPGIQESWSNYTSIDLSRFRSELNPSLVQDISPEETVVIIVLDVTLKSIQGKMNICLPGSLLVNLFDTLEKARALSNSQKEYQEEKYTDEIMNSIEDSSLEITASLGNTQILLSDVFNMQVGDIINLNRNKDSDIYLYIEDEPWFKGKMGVCKNNIAVKISEKIERI